MLTGPCSKVDYKQEPRRGERTAAFLVPPIPHGYTCREEYRPLPGAKQAIPGHNPPILPGAGGGIFDLMNSSGEEYRLGRLTSTARGPAGRGSCSVVKGVVSDVRRFHGSDEFEDDFTIMVARRL